MANEFTRRRDRGGDLTPDYSHTEMGGKIPVPVRMSQRCYSYSPKELARALGISVGEREWVVVEVDEDMVDVMVRG